MFTLPMMADVTYTYTGNDFTSTLGSYTTSDFVSGSFTVATALTAGLTEGHITPLSYSFSDGLQTLDNTNSKILFFFIGTNVSGSITSWDISVADPSDEHFVISTEHDLGGSEDSVQDPDADGQANTTNNITPPGTWMSQVDASPVPEPSSLALLGTGVLGLVGAGRRRFARG